MPSCPGTAPGAAVCAVTTAPLGMGAAGAGQVWCRVDGGYEHSFDRFAMWDDSRKWNDAVPVFDSNVFDLSVSDDGNV